MNFEQYFDKVYDDYDRYMIIPVAMVVFAVLTLTVNYAVTGEVVQKGLDFTGGSEIQFAIEEEFTSQEIETIFAQEGRDDIQAIRQVTADEVFLVIRTPPPELTEGEAQDILTGNNYNVEVESSRTIDATVSAEFFRQAVLAFVMAFTIMSIVIFVAFKDLTPSLAVIFAAAGDILFAMAGMAILGIPLTLGSLAALLMLIGYSVDTDIVLSTRVLKQRRGSLKDRIWSSAKTGITMSSGGIAGFTLLYIVSWMIVGPSELSNIAAVVVLGLMADMPLTWFGNALILKKYVEGDISTLSNLGEVFPWN